MQIHLNPFCSNYHPSLYQAAVAKDGLLIPIRLFIAVGSFAFNYWLNGTVIWTALTPYCEREASAPSVTLPEDSVSFSTMEIIPVPISRILGFVWFVGVFLHSMQYTVFIFCITDHIPKLLTC